MKKSLAAISIFGQVLFVWFFYKATFCQGACNGMNPVPILLLIIFFVVFDIKVGKLYGRFSQIKAPYLSGLIVLFPLLLYFIDLALNGWFSSVLAVVIASILILIAAALLWLIATKLNALLTIEITVLASVALFAVAFTFLLTNLTYAAFAYSKYQDKKTDIYITGNSGNKSSFIYFKLR